MSLFLDTKQFSEVQAAVNMARVSRFYSYPPPQAGLQLSVTHIQVVAHMNQLSITVFECFQSDALISQQRAEVMKATRLSI